MRPRKIKVGITDDHTLFREGMAGLLGHSEHLRVVLQASNGVDLIRKLKTKKNIPHVLLMDLQMPEMDGIKATKLLSLKYPKIRIVVLTMHNSDNLIVNLMQNGASGFLPKDSDFKTVEKAVCIVHKNGYYIDDRIAVILNRAATRKRINASIPEIKLTERENIVLKLLCEQLNIKEIATELGLSARTIESHKVSILKKTNTRNTAGMAIFAMSNNLLDNFIYKGFE